MGWLRAKIHWFVAIILGIANRVYQLPFLHGVLQTIGKTIKDFFDDDCHIMASAISFYAILSLIPFMLLLFSIIGYVVVHLGAGFSSEQELYAHLEEYIQGTVPFLTDDILAQLREITIHRQTFGISGLGALIFTAWSVFSTLELAFSRVFNTKRRRSIVMSNLLFIVFVVALGLVFLLVHYVVVVGKSLFVGSDLPLGLQLKELLTHYAWLRVGVTFVVATIVFVVLLKYFSKEKVKIRYALWGGLLFSGLWMMAIQVFGYYLENVASYSMLYGSLATLITIVIWIYYSSCVLLLCAEFTKVLQRRKLSSTSAK
jgi:Predicted membrane protein